MPTFGFVPARPPRRERHARARRRASWARRYDPFFVGQKTRTAKADFRLPELSLPARPRWSRLDDRRGLLRMVDRQAELLGWSGDGPGDRRLL